MSPTPLYLVAKHGVGLRSVAACLSAGEACDLVDRAAQAEPDDYHTFTALELPAATWWGLDPLPVNYGGTPEPRGVTRTLYQRSKTVVLVPRPT